MKGLVLAQSINKPGRHDANGAFVPSATHFSAFHGLGTPVWLDDIDDRNKMINTIASSRGLDVIAYFGHGEGHRLGSADIESKDIPDLASAVLKAASPGCRLILYACTAGKPFGFAQKLSSLLHGRVTVWGHSCAGHTYTNPYVTRYPYVEDDDQPFLFEPIEDFDPADPKDIKALKDKKIPRTQLFKKWIAAIKAPKADICARYPFMSKRMVEVEVLTGIRMSLSLSPGMVDAAENTWKQLQKGVNHLQKQAQKQNHHQARAH